MTALRPAIAVLSLVVLAVALLAALVLISSPGCKQLAKNPDEELKAEVPKRPFEELRIFTEPNEFSSFDPNSKEDRRIVLAAKPGHWTGVLVQGQANLADFDGTLETTAEDSQQRPVDLANTPYWLSTSRPMTLAKGQRKVVETLFFPPPPSPKASVKGSTWIANKLETRGGSAVIERVPEIVQHMPSFQYFCLVLASQPDRYRYLNDMTWVRPPIDLLPTNVVDGYYYRLLFPPLDQPLALPSESLCWTSTAVVIWDDVVPGVLSPEQQQALIDWLHWGGRLIISGPDSLDKLSGSALAEYLPANSEKSAPIEPAKLAELHKAWTLAGDNSEALGRKGAWAGIELVTRDQGEFVPNTAELVARRRVGRGMVVVTAFHLSEKALTQWPSYDGFFHACLLDRPARKFDTARGFEFVGDDAPGIYDPQINTGLRFLTRDETEPNIVSVPGSGELGQILFGSKFVSRNLGLIDDLKTEPGIAGWNDASWISSTVRQTLRDAAGISVPRRQFVLKMIGLYLLVIVPINWALFRLMGRVEWAWLAVPVVALAWGVLVVWLAQLDIGFARAQTQIDVVEVQSSYPRAHLTRYAALYSSLSSDYRLELGDTPAVALPFATGSQRLTGQGSSGVKLTSLGERRLTGYSVASNSTGMVHSEQMLDLGGVFDWQATSTETFLLRNATPIQCSGAAILRRNPGESTALKGEYAWLGTLDPGSEVAPQFEVWTPEAVAARRDADPLTRGGRDGSGELNLRKLLDCVENLVTLQPGETRLVAWCEETLGQFDVRPSTARARQATLIVVHLDFGPLPSPQRDINLRPLRVNSLSQRIDEQPAVAALSGASYP